MAGQHYGPAASHIVNRGAKHDRLEAASALLDRQIVHEIEVEIVRLEQLQRIELTNELESRRGSGTDGFPIGRDNDDSRER